MKRKNITDALIAFCAALILNITLSLLLQEKLSLFATAIAEIMIVLPAVLFVYFRKQHPLERFSLRLPTVKNFFASAFIFAGVTALQNGVTFVFYPIYYKNAANPDMGMLDSLYDAFPPLFILLCIAVIPAICEEMFFRGYLRTAFEGRGRLSLILSITVPALLFSAAHLSLYKTPATLIMGIGFGYMAYKTGSVILPMIFHFLASANTLINYFSIRSEPSDPEIKTMVLKDQSYIYLSVIAVTAGALLCFIGARLFAKRKLPLSQKLIPSIVAVIISISGVTMLISGETHTLVEEYRNKEVTDGEIITEEFICEQNTPCSVYGMFSYGEGITAKMTVKNDEGKEIYKYTGSEEEGLMLEKGKYTLETEFSVEENTEDTRVTYRIQIIGFAAYE